MRSKQATLRSSAVSLFLAATIFFPNIALASLQPFIPAETAAAAAAPVLRSPLKRQTAGCIANTFSCASQGAAFANICCANGQVCALDASNQPACCPSGAVCTGTAPASYVPPSTATAAASVSYVANSYFSFPYIPTSFGDRAACTSAVSQCSANYAACTSDLQGANAGAGAGYGVTIIVSGGGGTTVAGATQVSLAPTSASSICSSLSSVACFGLQSSQCTQSGTTNGFVVGGSGNIARPTAMPCVGVVGAVAAGVGLGVMGI